MNCKLLGCIAVLLLVLIFPASAAMVSFLIVETGLNDGVPRTEYGDLWEDALMASFFDSGHIVTNSPILRMEQKPVQDLSGTVMNDFEEAARGGAEYFVLCFLNYQVQGRRATPVDITIRTYRTDTQELVSERNFPAGRARSLSEESRFARDASGMIVSQIRDR